MGPSRSSGRTPPRAPTAGLSHLYRALPAYFGGKRRLTPLLFSALDDVLPRRSWANRRLLDPFLGGGAVALTAKAHGFEVHANDLARRSFVVGKALIENSESQLAASDVAALFTAISDPAVHASARRLLSAQQASFVAGAIPAIRAAPEPQCWLLELALIKWVLRCFPMSIPAATDARYAADLELDRISDRRVTHYLRARRSARPSVLARIAQDVNGGVLPGTGSASQLDAIDFLSAQHADVVYLDPPYPGTSSYEHAYAFIDELLEGDWRAASAYSGSAPPIAALLDAAEHIPNWLISYGGRDARDIVDLVRNRRSRVEVHTVAYQHLASLNPDRRIDELIIAARP